MRAQPLKQQAILNQDVDYVMCSRMRQKASSKLEIKSAVV